MRVGVLGGGQLGRMLALAGYPLGLQFRFYDPAPDAPAEHVAEQWIGAFDDRSKLAEFAANLDVITYEFENVPVATARFLQQFAAVHPSPDALETAQDRLLEKTAFQSLGIHTNGFAAVENQATLMDAIERVGLPGVLKTRRLGYDGKGQWVIRSHEDARHAIAKSQGVPLLYEAFVPFERELSMIAARGQDGQVCCYDLVQNHHRDGILRVTDAPAENISATVQAQAADYADKILRRFDYVGVLAIELFQCGNELLANEIAPRVHNSGHWTIEGAATSQFEMHLRAICGLPLGPPTTIGHSRMFNLIANHPPLDRMLAIDAAHVHLYGKAPRPGRKLGHVTVWAADAAQLETRAARVQAQIQG